MVATLILSRSDCKSDFKVKVVVEVVLLITKVRCQLLRIICDLLEGSLVLFLVLIFLVCVTSLVKG